MDGYRAQDKMPPPVLSLGGYVYDRGILVEQVHPEWRDQHVEVVRADAYQGAVDPAEIVAWLRGRTGYGGGFTSADDVADAIERHFITERGR
jgi:hypothetical protein